MPTRSMLLICGKFVFVLCDSVRRSFFFCFSYFTKVCCVSGSFPGIMGRWWWWWSRFIRVAFLAGAKNLHSIKARSSSLGLRRLVGVRKCFPNRSRMSHAAEEFLHPAKDCRISVESRRDNFCANACRTFRPRWCMVENHSNSRHQGKMFGFVRTVPFGGGKR